MFQSYTWMFSDQGSRPSQEDFGFQHKVTIRNNKKYAAWIASVADGHGGDQVSSFLKTYIPTSVIDIINKHHLVDTKWEGFVDVEIIKKEITDVIIGADSVIKQHLSDLNDTTDPGAVLSFYVVYGENILVFQLGDCKILIFTEDNKHMFETPSHDQHNKEEFERISKLDARCFRNKICGILEPSRVLGDLKIKEAFPGVFLNEPETFVIPIKSYERYFLLAVTDGINIKDLTPLESYVEDVSQKPIEISYKIKKDLFLAVISSDLTIRDNKTICFQGIGY